MIAGELSSWQLVWRRGFQPQFSDEQLRALLKGLRDDDPRLVQGCTTTPPPLLCVQDWPVEACCAIGYCGWQGSGLTTVGEVEEFFAKCCFEADAALEEPAACRWFLNFFDDTPRQELRKLMIEEIELELNKRDTERLEARQYEARQESYLYDGVLLS